MMDRYSLTVKVRDDYTAYADGVKDENGRWVKYEDVKAIEKTNEILANRCKPLVGNQTLYDSDFGRITGTQRPRGGE